MRGRPSSLELCDSLPSFHMRKGGVMQGIRFAIFHNGVGKSKELFASTFSPENFTTFAGDSVPMASNVIRCAIAAECSFRKWPYVFAARTPPSLCPSQPEIALKSTPASIALEQKKVSARDVRTLAARLVYTLTQALA